jgi:hypothetical protein
MPTKTPKATRASEKGPAPGGDGHRIPVVRLVIPSQIKLERLERALANERALAKIERERAVAAELASQLSSNSLLRRDVELVDFIDEGMPSGRKRDGIPKNLLCDAKDKFCLRSKSAILRAYNRGKTWKANVASRGFEFGKRNPGR